jgi:hypothetical protein
MEGTIMSARQITSLGKIYCMIVFAIHLQCHCEFARAADSDINKFMKEYGNAAKDIENHYERLRGTCKLSRQVDLKSKTRLIDNATFNIDHGSKKVSILRSLNSGEKGDRPEFVYCIAPDYSFTIARKPGEKSFEVRGIGSDKSDIVSYDNKFGRFLFAPFSIYDQPLSKSVLSKNFEIVSALEVKPNQFELEYLMGSNLNNKKDRIKLVLDPSRGWVIKSGVILPGSIGGNVKIEFQIDYQNEGTITLPKRVRYLEPTGLETICEFTSISTDPTNENEFKMAFYGLPEMTRSGNNSTRSLFSILLSMALLGLIVGAV